MVFMALTYQNTREKLRLEQGRGKRCQFRYYSCSGCYENSRTSYIDPYFETNVRNAKAAGLNVGVYIYSLAKSTDEMISQVKFFPEFFRDAAAEGRWNQI